MLLASPANASKNTFGLRPPADIKHPPVSCGLQGAMDGECMKCWSKRPPTACPWPQRLRRALPTMASWPQSMT